MRTLYLIYGVAVPKKTWKRRKISGEYIGANFQVVEVSGNQARTSRW